MHDVLRLLRDSFQRDISRQDVELAVPNRPKHLVCHLVRRRPTLCPVRVTKDWQGNIGEGQTRVAFWLQDDIDLARMTVVLGPPSRVLNGPWSVTLDAP